MKVAQWCPALCNRGQNIGGCSLSLLQGIFPTQGSNPGLPPCRWTLYQLSHKGNQIILKWVVYPFSSRSSQPRNQTRVSCIADRFFTNWAIREALKVYPSCSILPSSFFRLSILFSIYSEVELLNYVVRLFFFFLELPLHFPEQLYQFTFPSAEHKRFSFPTSTPVLAVFIVAILKGLKFYCIFAGHFTSLLGIGGTKMMLFA